MSERLILQMTADELRAISRKLRNNVDMRPRESNAHSLANRCGEIAELLEAPSALQVKQPDSEGIEDGCSG